MPAFGDVAARLSGAAKCFGDSAIDYGRLKLVLDEQSADAFVCELEREFEKVHASLFSGALRPLPDGAPLPREAVELLRPFTAAPPSSLETVSVQCKRSPDPEPLCP